MKLLKVIGDSRRAASSTTAWLVVVAVAGVLGLHILFTWIMHIIK